MRKLSLLLILTLFSAVQLLAQRTITGTVTSDDGKTLPAVTVLVNGDIKQAAQTDIDGKYSIKVPANGKFLRFSFVGMKTEDAELTSSNIMDISLQPEASQLEGVVVTALGISREKKSLGYAVQDVKGDALTKARESNVVNSLTGKVAGVQITNSSGAVGASSRIVLRGATSLSGDNQPLFVVDNVPISNSNFGKTDTDGVNRGSGIGDINPDDIESVSILKGPNAAAIYGSRASNGVVIITTKKGRVKKDGGIGIAYSNTTTLETPLRLPDFQNEYGQGANGKFSFVDGKGGGINDGTDESWGPRLNTGAKIPQWDSPVTNGVREATPWVSKPNNIKDFFRTGVTMTHNVAVEGGNENANFRLSYTNFKQNGMVPNTDFARNTFALSASGKPSKNLTAEGNISYVHSGSDNMPGYGYSGQNVMQQFLWFGRQVNVTDLKQYKNADGSKRSWNHNYHNNPYYTLNENLNKMQRDRLFGGTKLTYKINEWLSARIGAGVDYWTNFNNSRIAWGDKDHKYGSYKEEKQTFRESNQDILLMFNKKLTEEINLSLNAGGNLMQSFYHEITGEAPELSLPDVYNLSNSKVPQKTTNEFKEKKINSIYASGQVSYKSVYLDFTARNDWSSTLPLKNNSYFYPSVSLSAVFSDMIQNLPKWFTFGKVRFSFAQVGSDTDPYKLVPVLSFGDGWNAGTKLLNQYVPNELPNPELKPQRTTSFEFGTNLRFLYDRVNFDFTVYSQKTIDQIIPIPISSASGYFTKVINAGRIDNKGVEISLELVPVRTSDFEWSFALNFAKNVNKVVQLYPQVEQYTLGTYWDMKVMAIPGEPMGSLYGYDFKRTPDGQIINVNGLPDKGELKILGNYNPKWTGGLNNTLRYKGVELGFLLDYHHGGNIYSMTNTWGRYAGVLKETLIGREGGVVGDGVKLSADEKTYVPNDVVVTAEAYNHAAYNNSIGFSSVFDATYLKLREVKVSYVFKKIGKFPINDLSLSLIGRNLAILYSRVPHIDPETSFSNSNVQGLEFGQLPSARSIGFSIGFKF